MDGIKFPSPARMAWATLDPQTRQERLSYFAAKGWDHLTNYEKELLGRKPTANFSEGWQKLEETYSEQASQLHLQGSNMPRGQKLALAKWIRLSNTNGESIVGWNLEIVQSSADACATDIGNIRRRVCEIVGNDVIIWKDVPGSPKLDDIRRMTGTVQYHTQSVKRLNFQRLARLVAPKQDFLCLTSY